VSTLFTLPNGKRFRRQFEKNQIVSCVFFEEDETASVTTIAAAPHYLESWGDVVITKGTYSLTQPTIRPLFDTKQFQDALMSWNGQGGISTII
jgi:molybdopterin-containing oxidoreductase family iron-sulfur binding subunit